MRDSLGTFTALVLRDGARCYLCGQGDLVDDPLEIEHVRPKSARGSDALANLALAHHWCNQTKGTKAVAT